MLEDKELNPSPAVVEGEGKDETISAELGKDYGELSPNPNLVDEKVDGEHATPVKVVTPPIETPEKVFTKPVVFQGAIIYKGNVLDPDNGGEQKDYVVKFETSNITALTDEQIDSLKPGDVVNKITGNLKHSYKVTYKEEKHGICISYFAAGYTETVSYDYINGHWVYNSTDVVEIPNASDVQEMLIGKYVRIMPAPESTTLTDDELDKIKDGIFIDGNFLGFVNPVLFPAQPESNYLRGIIGGKLGTGYDSGFCGYSIDLATKEISVGTNTVIFVGNSGLKVLGKNVPSFPASTGTFVLKCVNGTLTWVEEE